MKIKRNIFTKLLNRYATDYFACSIEAGKCLYGQKTKSQKNIEIIHNAIDTNNFLFDSETRKKTRKSCNIENLFTLIHVGMFTEAKNHEFIIKVFKEINKKQPNSCLVLVGDGPLRENIETLSNNIGLKNKVKFLGELENVSNYLMAADCFIFPSKFEGLGMAVIEAQVSGLKCWVSHSVPKETNLFGQIDFLDINITPESWADAILANNNKRLTLTSQEVFESGYEIKKEALKLKELYLEKISGNKKAKN